jgi:hypothetical protein
VCVCVGRRSLGRCAAGAPAPRAPVAWTEILRARAQCCVPARGRPKVADLDELCGRLCKLETLSGRGARARGGRESRETGLKAHQIATPNAHSAALKTICSTSSTLWHHVHRPLSSPASLARLPHPTNDSTHPRPRLFCKDAVSARLLPSHRPAGLGPAPRRRRTRPAHVQAARAPGQGERGTIARVAGFFGGSGGGARVRAPPPPVAAPLTRRFF